jgi:tRNA threonylcarbamoyladenosine modification (KEOPS) complex  Pcc1 subunit
MSDLKYYDYIVKPNFQIRNIPGAGNTVITFWDYPNNRVVVSDEGYWNPTSPIGANLAIAVQWAHDQGLQAGVVLTPYSSNLFGDGVTTTAGGMSRPMPGATDQQLFDYIDAADFVVTDPYGVTPETCTPEVLNNFASFVTNVGNYANSRGKPTWLILQGFGPNNVDPNIIEAYNDRLVTENVHRFTDMSFFNLSDFRDDDDTTSFIQLNTQRAVNTLANITGIYPTYTITSAASVNEGSSLTFTATTTNVVNGTILNWSVTNAGDFAISTGTVTINSSTGTFSVTPTADITTEGAETFTASIYTGSTTGSPVATSNAVTINDTSNKSIVVFGDSLSTYGGVTLIPGQDPTVEASYAPDQTWSITYAIQKLYPNYTVTNVSRGGMTTSEALSGDTPVGLTNPFGASDTITQYITDNNPNKIVLRYGGADAVLTVNATTTLNNLQTIIDFAVARNIEVILVGVNPFAVYGNSGNPGYFPSTMNSTREAAALAINNGIISKATAQGLKYTNPRVLSIPPKGIPDGLHPYRHFGGIISRENLSQLRTQVPLNEQGTVPPETYTFSSPVVGTSVYEGGTVTFTLTTTGVTNGTVLWWNGSSDTGTQIPDILDPSPPHGSVTINSNSGTIAVTVATDAINPETDESFYIELFLTQADRDSFINPITYSNVVAINNGPAPSYVSFVGVTDGGAGADWYISEGQYTATFTLTTANVPNGTTLYWTTVSADGYGTITADDFTDGKIQDTVIVQNNTATITRSARADLTTEGSELFQLEIRGTSYTSPVLITSSSSLGGSIAIGDTSITPPVSSSDAKLFSLTISSGALDPLFDSNTTSYTASLANGVSSVTVTPTRNESHASIKVNGNSVTSGSASGTINLNVGANTITIVVTAQDGTTKTYTITVGVIGEPPVSSDARLSTLTISTGTLSPVFDSNTISYTASVLNGTNSVTITPTRFESHATITVNGNSVTSGLSSTINLNTGSNTITVIVTAQDGQTNKTYTIIVSRAAPTLSSDATLSALTISTGTLSPVFDSNTISYTADVLNGTNSVTVTPTRFESHAAITVNGNSVTSGSASGAINLNVGENTITVIVIAQDGQTTKTYTITITRASPGASSDARLSALTISTGTLTPSFNLDTISYTASVLNGVSSVTVTPTRNESNATIKVNNTTVTSGSPSGTINLNTGSNTITIVVIAQDNSTKTYTITVTRESALASYVSFVGVTDGGPGYDWYIAEGQYTATFTLTTTNVPNGTTLYWTTLAGYGTITANDFTDGKIQDTVIVQNNTATITRSARADLTTEGSELFQLEIRGTSYTSPVLITSTSSQPSGIIGIGDASTTPTLSSDATLSSLIISSGALSPAFSSTTTSYTDFVANEVSSVTVTPTRNESHATITVNGNPVTSGSASGTINLNTGSNTITVIVTAQDGATKTYTIAVTRAAPTLSSDATLSALTISSGALSPAFSSTTTSYVNSVENGTSSVTITPTRNESHATITVNGNSVTSGSASGTINLNTGSNTITIVVTAQDNSTKTYTIIVSRDSPSASNDATLSSLIISSGTLSPAFSSNTVSYTDFVANGVSLVSVTPTRNESHATITVNGNPVTSGSASGAINLNVGSNTITVIVTAQDGITTKTYTIVVGRASPTLSSDATLSSLIISSGTLSPAFSSSTISYTDSVANGTSSVTVTPTRNESHATITVNGSSVTSGSASGTINLNTGSNTITVIVTAQDNSTKTYTITVIRAVEGVISTYTITPVSTSINEGNALTFNVTTTDVPVDTELFWTVTYPVAAIALSNDATLSALTISSGTLNPSFSSGTISYIDFVANGVSSVTVTPTRNESHATITVNGSSVTSGSPSSSINLNVGSNTITIVVTAQDNSTKTYTIIVSRASPTLSSDATLSALTISSGILTPSFSSGTISYVDSVANEVSSVTVTPTRNESHATITVNGNSVTSGSASGAINLNVGLNTITIIVTSQDNGTKTYTIIVSRAAPAVSSDATLSSLIISSGALSPAFSSTTTSYVDSVANGTSSVTVTPTRNDSNATITVNGNSVTSGVASGAINLNVGSNTITIIVTAQDNSTKTYTIIVSRASPSASNDATLSSLTISSGTLTPSFSSGTIAYTDSVANGTSSITVTPTRTESHATITVNGNSVTSGSASGAINLNVGSNTITIIVTAQDNSTKTYTIIVNRALPGVSNNATLYALTISTGTLTPSFSSGIISYTANVANGVGSVTVTPTRTESHATITVNGSLATSGTPSNLISLNTGSNAIAVIVTAQDGFTTKTYTITVTRASPTLNSDARLSALTIPGVTLSPSFSSGIISYTASVLNDVSSVTITPTRNESHASIKVNGNTVDPGLSSTINLNTGSNAIVVIVTAQDGSTKTYTIIVSRAYRVSLGTVRASNNQVINVTIYDSAPRLGPIVYSLVDGTILPEGLLLDTKAGYLYGFIPYQPAYVRNYNIDIRSTKTITTSGAIVIVVTPFTLSVKGEVESSIEWVTGSNLGSVETGITSEVAVVAKQLHSNYTIKYSLTNGSLPNGLTLKQDGSISGKVTYNTTGTFTFTVLASDVYQLSSINRTFTLTVNQSDPKKYTEIYFKPFFSKQKREDYRTFISNEFTFDPKLLYRYFDPNFGVQHDIKMVVEFGIEQLNLDNYLPALSKNFYKKRFYFGDVKKAIAVDSTGSKIYEIVYIDPVDDMVNNAGISVIDTGTNYYPSVDNMRNHLKLLMSGNSIIGVNEYNKPKFMRTPQIGNYKPPTYMRVIPLCYALPGQGDKIISRIKLSGFNFKLLNFEVDRLIVQESADNTTAKYLMLEGKAL